MKDSEKKEIYKEWKNLVNMTPKQLKAFLSEYGDEAGMSLKEAKKEGIKSGRTSAKAILRMKARKKSEWTKTDWEWAQRQINFIKRFLKKDLYPRHDLFNDKGEKTRYLMALNLWGHDPFKFHGIN